MSESLSDEFYGATPPGRDDWSINTVAKRTASQPAECAVTGDRIEPGDWHRFATLRKPTREQPDVETVAFVDEAAFREWMIDG